jgi:peptidoglycan/xylan/chitin deacetylase (PgdA/CDA1 family)
MWSALSMDYHPNVTAKQCYEKANAKIKSGDILLFHDSKKAAHKMKYAVERILKEKTEEGYEFLGFNH